MKQNSATEQKMTSEREKRAQLQTMIETATPADIHLYHALLSAVKNDRKRVADEASAAERTEKRNKKRRERDSIGDERQRLFKQLDTTGIEVELDWTSKVTLFLDEAAVLEHEAKDLDLIDPLNHLERLGEWLGDNYSISDAWETYYVLDLVPARDNDEFVRRVCDISKQVCANPDWKPFLRFRDRVHPKE